MGNMANGRFGPPQEPLLLLVLLLLGFAGNFFSFPLFFGVDFLFGSICSLIVLSIYGRIWGVVSAVIVSSYTYVLWGHPYAIVIFTLELLVVGGCLVKTRHSLLMCAGAFWIFVGIPAVFLFYHVIMDMDRVSTLLIMLKQGTNGIFNALVASLLINLLPVLRYRLKFGRSRSVPLREILINFMVALVLFPVLGVMFVEGRSAMNRMERGIAANLKNLSVDVSRHLQAWYEQRLHAVRQLASMAAATPPMAANALQSLTETTKRMFPDFHNMYIADAAGTTIAFFPPFNEKGQSTLGLNFSDRSYYKELKAGRSAVLSKVFMGRGGVFSPIVTLSAAVIVENQFRGYALAALDLARIRNLVDQYSQKGQYRITLCDAEDRIISSSVSGREPMQFYDGRQSGNLKPYGQSFYLWSPDDPHLPAVTRYRRSLYVTDNLVSEHLPWKIIVEFPVSRQQQMLFTLYNRYLATILIFAVVTFLLTSIISPRLARPLTHLARLTEQMLDPQRLSDPGKSHLPQSPVTEIDSLVSNFEAMEFALKSNFLELEKRSEESERINSALKTKIKELEAARQAVRESEEKALSMLNAITEPMMLVDTAGTVLAANSSATERFGKKADDLIEKPLSVLFLDHAHPQQEKDIYEVFKSGKPVRRETEYLDNIFDTHYYPVFDSRGFVTQVAVFGLDITEKRRLEARLQRAEKMEAIGTLAGGVAHDLNNILSGIVSYPELLLLDLPQESASRQSIETIKKSGEKAAAIVQDLLTLSRRGGSRHSGRRFERNHLRADEQPGVSIAAIAPSPRSD